jgi:hypothetical protein
MRLKKAFEINNITFPHSKNYSQLPTGVTPESVAAVGPSAFAPMRVTQLPPSDGHIEKRPVVGPRRQASCVPLQGTVRRRVPQGTATPENPGERHTGPGLGLAAANAEKAPHEVRRRGGETIARRGTICQRKADVFVQFCN